MPRLNKELRDELKSQKGKMSQAEAAEAFGVTTSTVSRMWKDVQVQAPTDSVDRFDVEMVEESKREKMEIETQHDSFLSKMEDTMERFQEEIKRGDNPPEPVPSDPQGLPDVPREFSDVLPPVPGAPQPVPTELQSKVAEATRIPTVEDLLRDAEEDGLVPPVPMDVEDKPAPKKRKRKAEPKKAPSKVQALESTVGTMPLVEPPKVKVMPREMLVARIHAYIQRHASLLTPYIGSTQKEKDAYLKSMGTKSDDKLREDYASFKSLVSFRGQTMTAYAGAIAVTGVVEGVTRRVGLKTHGMTRQLMEDPGAKEELMEICEDNVAENWERYAKVNRSEFRFLQLLARGCQARHAYNSAQVEMPAEPQSDSEDEGVEESKEVHEGFGLI